MHSVYTVGMTPAELSERLARQEVKIEAIYVSVEKTRKYLLIIMWSSLAMIVLPLIAALLIVSIAVSVFTSTLAL